MNRPMTRSLAALFASALVACGGGGSDSSPPPPPPPPPAPAAVAKSAGDTQHASPGTSVTVDPQVTVTDSAGNPMAGIEVDFAAASGSGTVAHASATTDAAGHASSGAWTLGAAKGTDTLVATVAGVAPATFTAQAIVVSPGITITTIYPDLYPPGTLVGNNAPQRVKVQSTNEIVSVSASARDHFTELEYNAAAQEWDGVELDLTGQPAGPVDIIITATDALGNSTDLDLPVVIDRKATLAITSPLDGALARPNLDIDLTCTDDSSAGCASVTVAIENGSTPPTTLASGTNTISQSVDLSAYEGRQMTLDITAVDAAGQQTVDKLTVYVDSSAHMPVLQQRAGPIWDVSGTRTFYVDPIGYNVPQLRIADSTDASDRVVDSLFDNATGGPGSAFLTPGGALYILQGADVTQTTLRLAYNAGGSTTLQTSASYLQVAGNWAIWNGGFGGPQLWLYDIAGASATQIAPSVLNWGNGVAANGDVVYSANGVIYRYRAGSATALPAAAGDDIFPATDGSSVVYASASDQNTRDAVLLNDGAHETTLAPSGPISVSPGDYRIANGWVAYPRPDAMGNPQIWRHGPSGEQQLTVLETENKLEGILSDGSVLLRANGRRFLAVPGQALEDVGAAFGTVVVRDDRFIVLLGTYALGITP